MGRGGSDTSAVALAAALHADVCEIYIYMKGFERDTIMYEKGQEAERKNTERERQRADFAEKEKIKAPKETTEALKRVAELEKILQCKTTEGK